MTITASAGVYPSRNISIGINSPASKVYEFLSHPENFQKWAAGLSKTKMKKEGPYWTADSPMGLVKIRFTDKNDFGVADHDVILPSGEVNHNPLRVVKNNEGSEVIFTLYRLPRMSDKDFEEDAGMVEKDLKKLKSLLE